MPQVTLNVNLPLSGLPKNQKRNVGAESSCIRSGTHRASPPSPPPPSDFGDEAEKRREHNEDFVKGAVYFSEVLDARIFECTVQHLTFREVAPVLRVANYCLIFAQVASVATHVAIPEGNT